MKAQVKAPVKIPKVINHKNVDAILAAARGEPYLTPGPGPKFPPAWLDQAVNLEFPLGELCENGMKTLSLTGGKRPQITPLDGTEGFNAQGLEGKAVVRMPLLNALLLINTEQHELCGLNPFRGRIVTR